MLEEYEVNTHMKINEERKDSIMAYFDVNEEELNRALNEKMGKCEKITDILMEFLKEHKLQYILVLATQTISKHMCNHTGKDIKKQMDFIEQLLNNLGN